MVIDGNLNQKEFSNKNSPLASMVKRYYIFKERMADIEFIGNTFLYRAAKAPKEFLRVCQRQLIPQRKPKNVLRSSKKYFGES